MQKQHFFLWILFAVVVAGIFGAYYLSNRALSDDLMMPMDDVYIHFQYAKQMANGQAYIYNPGDAPSSGATSFIYPYLLSLAYLLGFQGLNLGLGAMLMGALALFASMWAIYRLAMLAGSPYSLAIFSAVSFALMGSIAWHFMSAMETGLMVCFTLWTVLGFIEKRDTLFLVAGSLLALTRPEGSLMAGVALLLYVVDLRLGKSKSISRSHLPLMIIFILAMFIQPLLNRLLTGSISASGSQAKSLLGQIPTDWGQITQRILEQFLRMWLEFLSGFNVAYEIWYLPILLGLLAMIGLGVWLRQPKYRLSAVLIMVWLLGVSLAISSLDTAFWHFKRYQIPLMALFFPLSLVAVLALAQKLKGKSFVIYSGYACFVSVFVIVSGVHFINLYQVNIKLVYEQPFAMANWLAENTDEDALIAVHDVGMMRYIGERHTLDMVGLTTAAAANYWRNGVGSVAEFLLDKQPDLIASYGVGHGYGLGMLAETRLYAHPVAEFPVEIDPKTNVALATDYQAIYQPDWDLILKPESEQAEIYLNVADLESEAGFDYQWENDERVIGFATEVYDFPLLGCEVDCLRLEAGRKVSGRETFRVVVPDSWQGQDVILVSRLHPVHSGTLDIYVNDHLIDRQWIPYMPGNWLDIQTRIPAGAFEGELDFRIEADLQAGEYYVPVSHRLYAVEKVNIEVPADGIASFQEGHLRLLDYSVESIGAQMDLVFDWWGDGQSEGDYRFFVHLYEDLHQPPVVQGDAYLDKGSLLPGNWLSGRLRDTITLNIESLPAGDYHLVIGFYDPIGLERLVPFSDDDQVQVLEDGRLILREVEIK